MDIKDKANRINKRAKFWFATIPCSFCHDRKQSRAVIGYFHPKIMSHECCLNQYYILNTYIIENKIKIKCNVILIEHFHANRPTRR